MNVRRILQVICTYAWFTRGRAVNQDITIRLKGSSLLYAGRVEIKRGKGDWGTICDTNWDIEDARVVCAQLGFSGAEAAIGGAAYGPGSGPGVREVKCLGNESAFQQCTFNGWNYNMTSGFCDHSRDAGVLCTPNKEPVRLELIILITGVAALFVSSISLLIITCYRVCSRPMHGGRPSRNRRKYQISTKREHYEINANEELGKINVAIDNEGSPSTNREPSEDMESNYEEMVDYTVIDEEQEDMLRCSLDSAVYTKVREESDGLKSVASSSDEYLEIIPSDVQGEEREPESSDYLEIIASEGEGANESNDKGVEIQENSNENMNKGAKTGDLEATGEHVDEIPEYLELLPPETTERDQEAYSKQKHDPQAEAKALGESERPDDDDDEPNYMNIFPLDEPDYMAVLSPDEPDYMVPELSLPDTKDDAGYPKDISPDEPDYMVPDLSLLDTEEDAGYPKNISPDELEYMVPYLSLPDTEDDAGYPKDLPPHPVDDNGKQLKSSEKEDIKKALYAAVIRRAERNKKHECERKCSDEGKKENAVIANMNPLISPPTKPKPRKTSEESTVVSTKEPNGAGKETTEPEKNPAKATENNEAAKSTESDTRNVNSRSKSPEKDTAHKGNYLSSSNDTQQVPKGKKKALTPNTQRKMRAESAPLDKSQVQCPSSSPTKDVPNKANIDEPSTFSDVNTASAEKTRRTNRAEICPEDGHQTLGLPEPSFLLSLENALKERKK